MLFDNLCNKQEPRLQQGKFSPSLCSFVERQLQRKPDLRASAIQLQAHEFILRNLSQVRQEDLMRWLNSVMREKEKPDTLGMSGHGMRRR